MTLAMGVTMANNPGMTIDQIVDYARLAERLGYESFWLTEDNIRDVFVVHGSDGLDEISNTGESHIAEVREGTVRAYTVRPEDFGVPRASIAELRGGDRGDNAEIIRAILDGQPGPRRDIVLMNAAGALVASSHARDFKEGVAIAAESIDSGAARKKLEGLIALSQRLAHEK